MEMNIILPLEDGQVRRVSDDLVVIRFGSNTLYMSVTEAQSLAEDILYKCDIVPCERCSTGVHGSTRDGYCVCCGVTV